MKAILIFMGEFRRRRAVRQGSGFEASGPQPKHAALVLAILAIWRTAGLSAGSSWRSRVRR